MGLQPGLHGVAAHASFALAMRQAVGRSLLVEDDDLAAEIVRRHGVPCVSFKGTRHERGKMQGVRLPHGGSESKAGCMVVYTRARGEQAAMPRGTYALLAPSPGLPR